MYLDEFLSVYKLSQISNRFLEKNNIRLINSNLLSSLYIEIYFFRILSLLFLKCDRLGLIYETTPFLLFPSIWIIFGLRFINNSKIWSLIAKSVSQ